MNSRMSGEDTGGGRPLRILVNATTVITGGGVQVADSFVGELANYPEHRFLVLCSPQVAKSLGDLSDHPEHVRIEACPRIGFFGTLDRLLRRNPKLDALVRQFRADAVFTVFGPSYWRPQVPHVCGWARGYDIYTDSPFYGLVPPLEKLKLSLLRKLHRRMFRLDADTLFVESEDARERLQRVFPKKRIEVVGNTYHQIFEHPELQEELPLPPFDGATLLTLSANYPHKNLRIIPSVARYLKEKHPDFRFRFVVSQPPEVLGLPAAEIPDWLLPLGVVSIRKCPSLYRQSTAMFLPTLVECFTASYPEAMRMRVPVVTADLSFAHGICGEAAEFFSPMDPASAGEAIYRVATDSGLRARLVAAGTERLQSFDDSRMRARKFIRLIEDAVARSAGGR